MTIKSENSSSGESNDNIPVILHESFENCQEYLQLTENLIRAEGTIIEKVHLAKENKAKKYLGKPVIIRGLPWKLYVSQNYAHNGEKYLYVSVYCDANLRSSWSCNTKCRITLVNSKNESDSITNSFAKFFYFKEYQHIVATLVNMKEIYAPNNPYVTNKTIELRVFIQAEAPHGLMWDSKRVTGYVGLRNQGATCYLNSLLQTFYFCEPLRKIIYKVPTEILDNKTSVVAALQFIFYDLQRSDFCVDTKRLTNAFGWGTSENCIQHDVQEMCRILLDNVEEKMKGTIVENEIKKLLEGKLISYIKCINVDYESKREESFYDIQLNIKDKKNIYESFDDYISEILFVDDNKYNSGVYGLQDAKKGIIFKSFPPVLHLHLLRFQYDMLSNLYYKVHDRFEFPNKLILQKYMEDKTSCNPDDPYLLQSVLVHSGDQNGGHYVVFISPHCDDIWYKFDDDVVSQVTSEDAIDNNFGLLDGNNIRSSSTAYMLCYILSSTLNNPENHISESDIPVHLQKLYEDEIEFNKMDTLFRNDRQNYQEIYVAFDDNLFEIQNGNIVDFTKLKFLTFTVDIQCKIGDLLTYIGDHMNISKETIRIWSLREKSGFSTRPLFVNSELSKYNLKTYCQRLKPLFFIQRLPDPTINFIKNANLLLFVHFFKPDSQTLYYTGIIQVSTSSSWKDILGQFTTDYPIDNVKEFSIFFEKQQSTLVQIENLNDTVSSTFSGRELDSEMIVIQQKVPSENFIVSSFRKSPVYPFQSAKEFVADLVNNVIVQFFDVNVINDECTFSLILSKHMRYEHYIKLVSVKLGVPSEYIRLFKARASRCPAVPIKSNTPGSLDEIFLSLNRTSDRQKLFYLILKIPVQLVEDKSLFYLAYSVNNNHSTGNISIFIGANDNIENIKTETVQALKREGLEVKNPIRFVEYGPSKLSILNRKKEADAFVTEVQNRRIRVDEIPDDQLLLSSEDVLICVYYKNKNQINLVPKPFFIKISPTSTYLSIVNQIKEYSEAKIDTIYFTHVLSSKVLQLPDNLDSIFSLDKLLPNNEAVTAVNNVLENFAFIVEISQNSVISHRTNRGDHSLKIRN